MAPPWNRAGTAALTSAAAAVLLAVVASPAIAASLKVTGTPSLSPAFNTGVSDYVSTCDASRPLRLAISAPAGTTVSVDGKSPRSGQFSVKSNAGQGESTLFVVHGAGGKARYHVRCRPSNFPRWKFERFGTPQAQWSLISPVGNTSGRYLIFVDSHGVPVWWRRMSVAPFNSLLLPDGNLAWTRWYQDPFGERASGAWEVHRLDGTPVRTLKTIGSPTDTHDMEPLSNGHYLLDTYRVRKGVNLVPYGGPANSKVVDGEIQEIAPDGTRVWSWSSKDHIPLSETQDLVHRRVKLRDGTKAYDVFHLNSMEPDGDGIVISSRHTNAVYRIKRATGAVTWKLGGTPRPESLTVSGDPEDQTFGGQHDARLLPDGSLTVYDNRSGIGAPRAVRFAIDTTKLTATFVEQVKDPQAKSSGSQGSARRLAGGDWVVSWGQTHVTSEISALTGLVTRLTFNDAINYRTFPIPYGRLKASALRQAMDRMHPRR
jgi:hypothetical protein